MNRLSFASLPPAEQLKLRLPARAGPATTGVVATLECQTQGMSTEDCRPDAHVVFDLAVDEDGWPPVSAERVWAFSMGADLYLIDNVPWFVRDLAVGDVVRAEPPGDNMHPVFSEVVERSDHVTVRLVCFRAGPLAGDLPRALAPFTAVGVYGEGLPQYGLLALDIAPNDPLDQVVDVLRRGQADGWWEYEEGRVTDAWLKASA